MPPTTSRVAVDDDTTDPSTPLDSLRRAALAALVANIGIIVTGGVVRLTGSGLGCPDWPTCEGRSVVPPADTSQWHTWIEFGNRLMTFVVLATAAWVVVAAWRAAWERDDVRRLALLQPIGVIGQAVLGGVTVLTGLHPLIVAAHLLASMVLVAGATALHHRVSGAGTDRAGGLRPLTTALVVVAGAVLVLGTLVTAAGPHAGDPGTVRLGLDIRTFAIAHADAVWLLVGLTIATWLVARGLGARHAASAAAVLLAVEVVQGGIGYLQYALGIPALPVAFHLLGAALVWMAAWRLAMSVRPAGTARPGVSPAEA